MVNAVVNPQYFQEILWRRVRMNGIMHEQVQGITKQQTGYQSKYHLPEDQFKEEEKERTQENAYDWGHGQTVFVFRVIVVVAVKFVLNVFLEFVGWLHVEHVAVRHVFNER